MYTTETIPVKMQHDIINNATAAVKSYVLDKYSSIFTKEDVEEIIGNTIAKACRSIGSYNDNWALSTWMGKIARNCVKDELDGKMKRRPISGEMYVSNDSGDEICRVNFGTYRGDEYEADRELLMEEFTEAVDDCVKDMSDRDKAFFEMMKDEKTPIEMAKEDGCNANAAAIRSCLIRKRLRQPLSELAEEYGISYKKLAS